ncbi:MAG: response regulator [Cellulosilyticaceae bacterium]
MYRVLIADDEPIERMILCKIIKENFEGQLEVVQAVNGREAVERFKMEKCEIVILDIEMPGINGLEAAEKIRAEDKDCSIIFLTAFDYFTYAKKAIAVKVLDYLLKPSTDEQLIAVLEEAIRVADEKENSDTQNIPSSPEKMIVDSEKMEHIRSSAVQERILEFIKAHYMKDISLQDAAQTMNYSDAYFCKIFKQCFDRNFTSYLSEFRVEKAKGLLSDVTINIKEISDKVGYRDSNYFAKVFKRVEGVTPSEYRMIALENKER